MIGVRLSRALSAASAAALVAVAAGWTDASAAARKDARTFTVRPAAKAYGRSFKDWTETWWQWATSIPASVNPLLDETGAFAEVGQHGPVWFLCGAITSSAVTRTCTIPAGKAVFFPIVNYSSDQTSFGGQEVTVEQLRADAAAFIAAVDFARTTVTLDGVPIPGTERARVQSDPYDFTLPQDNLFEAAGIAAPAGVYRPGVSDGYWVMLRPLSEGAHELRIDASLGAPYDFTFTVTYHLQVVEKNRP